MSDPYRDGEQRELDDSPRDRGIVGDVIAQFADPYAFYRELVQNSIDAGTADIHIELWYDAGEGRMHVAVRDKGDGMTREIVENQLLVLFRSTKEKDRTKIGKFGIGFSSVLAPDPEVVIITTVRDGKKLVCHLYRDLRFELFDSGRGSHSGTTVELEVAMTPQGVQTFCNASASALRRWCRHASVPIELVIRDGEDRSTTRIDRPVDIEGALVEVRYTSSDGQLTVLAGLTKTPTPYVGFFNHGLMLAELDENLFGSVAVKIQDSRLGHTLSRDNVRRDKHYDHAVAVASNLVHEDLRRRVGVRLRELAEAEDHEAFVTLADVIVESGIQLQQWTLPLVEPRDGHHTVAASELSGAVWGAPASSALTKALAADGTPVLRVTKGWLMGWPLMDAHGLRLRDVEAELTLATTVTTNDHDDALLALVGELLDKVIRSPAGVVLVQLAGARADALAVALRGATPSLVDLEGANKSPFAFLGRRTLALSVKHRLVAAARESDDPVLAASHLVRAILLQYRLLDEDRSRKILDHTLAGLGVES